MRLKRKSYEDSCRSPVYPSRSARGRITRGSLMRTAGGERLLCKVSPPIICRIELPGAESRLESFGIYHCFDCHGCLWLRGGNVASQGASWLTKACEAAQVDGRRAGRVLSRCTNKTCWCTARLRACTSDRNRQPQP